MTDRPRLSQEVQNIKDFPSSGAFTLATEPTLQGEPPLDSERVPTVVDGGESAQKVGGFRFWMIFVAMMVSTFLSALDFTSVSTALPVIVQDLRGTEFAWVGSAFALGSTAILPLTGGLAQIFGRRPVVLGSLVLFALGSGVSGGASTMNMLIAGRAIQGVGGGGILSLTEIVVSDLVPLAQRGTYLGLIGSVWAIAAAIGPPIGGAFSQTNWRWLFYLNLPLTAIAIVLVWVFLRLKIPQDDFNTKMKRMDWFGNGLIIVATTITIVALTWGGVKHPWSSYQVLVPLILGLVATAGFFYYEAKYAIEPVVPWELVNNRTAFFGYIGVFLHGIVSTAVIFYLPVYFQASLLQGPIHSGVSVFGNSFLIPSAAIAAGISVAVFKVYVPQNYVGWIMTSIGVGLLTLLKVSSPTAAWVGYQVIEGIGFGIIWSAPQFAVLAPVKVTESAHALALFVFVRSYSQTWAVTLGGTILQNELKKKLPKAFLDLFPGQGVEITYAAIPRIGGLEEPLKRQVRDAFAESMRTVWLVFMALSLAGLVSLLGMKQLKMSEVTDEAWGMEDKPKVGDEEKKGETITN